MASTALRLIGEEWKSRANELADWAMDHLVNRKDVWGQFTVATPEEERKTGKSYKVLTLPQKAMRGKDMVTLDKLRRHFSSIRRNHLIGLHSINDSNESKWIAIDIDMHSANATDAEDVNRRNFRAALHWWKKLQSQGYDPLLMDTNGMGGYHIWILFGEPVPTPGVFFLANNLISDWEEQNLDMKPETYPKRPVHEQGKFGASLRLPGLHHWRDHYTKIWSGDEWLDDPWLTGSSAVDMMLNITPGPPPPQPTQKEIDQWVSRKPTKNKAEYASRSVFAHKKKGTRTLEHKNKKRPKVCLDLDGVLAIYDGWKGAKAIGPPIDGALEFAREIASYADIILYSVRFSPEGSPDRKLTAKEIIERIEVTRVWLNDHGFPEMEIYIGKGKPIASVYVDDRAVVCDAQEEGPTAYLGMDEQIRRLCKV